MSESILVKLLINSPNVRQQFEKKLFRGLDVNHDGKLQLGEVQPLAKALCKQVGLAPPSREHVASVFKACDTDNSGWLGLSQFDTFFMKLLHKLQRDVGTDVEISFMSSQSIAPGKHKDIGKVGSKRSSASSKPVSSAGYPSAPVAASKKIVAAESKAPERPAQIVEAYNALQSWGRVDTVAWSPSGNCLAVGNSLGAVILITLSDCGTATANFLVEAPPNGNVTCIKWSPDEAQLAYTDSRRQSLVVIDVKSKAVVFEVLQSPSASATVVDWCGDGARLAVGCHDGATLILNARNGFKKESQELKESSSVTCVAWCPDDVHLAIGYYSGLMNVVDATSGVVKLSKQIYMMESVQWAPVHSQAFLITCDHRAEDNCIQCFTTVGGKAVGSFSVPPGMEPYGDWLPTEVMNAAMQLGKTTVTLLKFDGEIFWSSRPQVEGMLLAFGGWTGEEESERYFYTRTEVLDFQSGDTLGAISGAGNVKDIQWSPDGTKLLAAGSLSPDGVCLTVLEAQSCKVLRKVPYGGDWATCLALSPDGSLAACGRPLKAFDARVLFES